MDSPNSQDIRPEGKSSVTILCLFKPSVQSEEPLDFFPPWSTVMPHACHRVCLMHGMREMRGLELEESKLSLL